MKDKDYKRHVAYEVLVFLGLLAIFLYMTRLWPILLLVILGIFIAAIRLLFLANRRVEPAEPILALPAPKPQPSETDMENMVYMLIQRRITQILTDKFPNVRWIWENARAKEDILAGNPVYVILNKAGGYRRARVVIHNLQVFDVLLDDESSKKPPEDKDPPAGGSHTDSPEESDEDEIPENYGLLAFQWVEAHVMELNERCNEAIAQGVQEILICADELPVRESWDEICKELARNDLPGAQCCDEGIIIEIEQ